MSRPLTFCIDFDGTIVDHEWPGVGKLKEGVVQALSLFKALGVHIIVSSCRNSQWFPESHKPHTDVALPAVDRQCVADMKRSLDDNGVPYDEIDMGDKGKPLADLYIDDKGLRFTNWWDVVKFVQQGGMSS